MGYDHDTHGAYYETREIHRHLSFLNFLTAGLRVGWNATDRNVPSAEMVIVNCIFANSTVGISLLSYENASFCAMQYKKS